MCLYEINQIKDTSERHDLTCFLFLTNAACMSNSLLKPYYSIISSFLHSAVVYLKNESMSESVVKLKPLMDSVMLLHLTCLTV